MAVYAYLRVSTDWRDVQNRRHGILEYANVRNLELLEFVEDEASGRMNWPNARLICPRSF
jgi:DNA invertase Pin-like site-specific DNA recombinase